jgi:Zn-finger nucleic acid-binding protein
MVLVNQSDYFFCEYCGSFHFPNKMDEGIRILLEASDDRPEGLNCPVCTKILVQAAIDGMRALYCENCRGMLLAQEVFGTLVNLRRSRAVGEGESPKPLNRKELERKITCPICSQLMDTHPYYGPGNVVIDNCASCHLIWLDAAELKAIENAPGSDRGQPLSMKWVENSENSLLRQSLRRRGLLKE